MSKGNFTNPFNAVTYYVDHVRGRGEVSAAVESSINGAGAQLKTKALDLAVEYVQLLQQI